MGRMSTPTLGETLRSLRLDRKLNQSEMGALIGRDRVTINRHEKNRQQPDIETLREYARVHRVPIARFLSLSSRRAS